MNYLYTVLGLVGCFSGGVIFISKVGHLSNIVRSNNCFLNYCIIVTMNLHGILIEFLVQGDQSYSCHQNKQENQNINSQIKHIE